MFKIIGKMFYLAKIIRLIQKGRIKTKYSHHNLIYRRGSGFVFSVDCSGLLEFWLSKKHPAALKEVYDFTYRVRPVKKEQIKRLYSFDFYDYFCSLSAQGSPCWQLVENTKVLVQGDVIVFINSARIGRPGHIAIVDEEILRQGKKIVVRVIDSSTVEHMDDYRQSAKKGIGRGVIELNLDNAGKIASVCYAPRCYKPRNVVMARLRQNENL